MEKKRELDDGKGFLQENKARGRITQAPGARKQVTADNHPKRMTGHDDVRSPSAIIA